MAKTVSLTLPLTRADLADLEVGDEVLLSGPVYTMRDAGHERALQCLEDTGRLPFDLEGATLFYAGPTPAAAGRPLGSVGPTTASRMDFATPRLFEAGIVAAIGKGKRSPEVVKSCQETGSVYLCTVGGIAALLAKSVTESELIGWEDLGTEALRKLTLKDFPTYVAVDTKGGDLYREIEAAAQYAQQSQPCEKRSEGAHRRPLSAPRRTPLVKEIAPRQQQACRDGATLCAFLPLFPLTAFAAG